MKTKKITIKNRIDFIYNSNMIEGIDFDRILYFDKAKSPYLEISGHWNAFQYVLDNCKTDLTEKKILKIHKLLTKSLLDEQNCGHYRKCNVYIGNTMGAYPVAIKPMMNKLIKSMKKAKIAGECWECHHEFEMIHPFVDGNGRTGRMILNWLLLKNNLDLQIVSYLERQDYYNKIRTYRFYKVLEHEINKN